MTTLLLSLILIVINFPLFWFDTGSSGPLGMATKVPFNWFCPLFTALGTSLTSTVYHFGFIPGIYEGLLPVFVIYNTITSGNFGVVMWHFFND